MVIPIEGLRHDRLVAVLCLATKRFRDPSTAVNALVSGRRTSLAPRARGVIQAVGVAATNPASGVPQVLG